MVAENALAFSNSDPVKFVRSALSAMKEGKSQQFDIILSDIRGFKRSSTKSQMAMENQVKETFKWIQALGKVITQLGKKETAVLIDAILNLDVGSLMEQSRDDESLFGKYVEFLENLVSAHAFYSSRVLEKLVFHLRKGPKLRPEVIEKERELKFERFSQRIHHALMNVLRIVPSSTTNLASLLLDHFPQKHDTAETHIQFTRQVLKICRYAPILRNQIMELLIDRMIQIDSEITVDVDELDEEDLKVLENMPSSDEETDDDLESEDEDEIEDQGQALHEMIVMEESDDELACATAEESRASALARTKSMLDKLDGMIKLLFEFFEDFSSHTVAKNPPSESLSSIYNALLSVFDRIILRTHKCKYTQTLIFYFTSLHSSFSETFLSLLLIRMFDPSIAMYLRCTASAYFSSFLARAKHVDPGTISHCLKLCADWIHGYLDKMEQNSVGLDLSKHAIFYSAVQSVLYVFCFRWKELTCVEPSTQAMPGTPYKRRRLNSLTCANGIAFAAGSDFDDQVVEESDYGDDASTATGLASPHMEWWKTRGGFQRVIFSRLNPLQACSRTVVTEFDKISQQLEMIYCSSLIEMNAYNSRQTQVKALPLQVDSATGQNFVEEVIEAFFPFDPYYNHLSSREQIDSLYVRWHTEDVPSDGENDEES